MFVMRKQMLLTFLGCFVITLVYCQRMELPVVKVNSYGYALPQNFYSPNNVGNNYGGADVQNQFKNGQWTRGRVKFQNGQEMNNILLLFDVYQNKLYFKQGDVTMEFVHPVYEFEIGLVIAADTAGILYRAYYPSVNKNTGETFYEVVVDAGIQLLRCRAKNVNLYKDDEPEQKRKTNREQWYMYVGGKMVYIKKDKNHIMSALPEYAAQIDKIIKDEGLNLSNSEHLIDLAVALNKL